MFVCGKCHLKSVGAECASFIGSYGPCEICHKVSSCTDCHCDFKPKKKSRKGKS